MQVVLISVIPFCPIFVIVEKVNKFVNKDFVSDFAFQQGVVCV